MHMNKPFYLHGSTGLQMIGANGSGRATLDARMVRDDDVGKEVVTTDGMAVVIMAVYVPDVGTLVREAL